jgi:hypothetical protein
MWTLDPAIRDFVGHARDYAFDWNAEGGVPGTGPLGPGDDVTGMVRRILGEEAGEAAEDERAAADASRDCDRDPCAEDGHAFPAALQRDAAPAAPEREPAQPEASTAAERRTPPDPLPGSLRRNRNES